MDNGTTLLGLDGLVVEQVREQPSGLLEILVAADAAVLPAMRHAVDVGQAVDHDPASRRRHRRPPGAAALAQTTLAMP